MPTILLSAPYMIPFPDRFRLIFENFGLELLIAKVEERLEEAELLEYAGKYDGVICGDDRYTRRVIEASIPRLKVISKWGTGVDSIDKEACDEFDVMLGNTPNAFTEPVADSVFGYMLTFARQHPRMDREMKKGVWKKIPGKALKECTLGIIGIGNIGSALVKRAQPFGIKVLGTDIREIDPEFVKTNKLEMVDIDELLSRSDFVSVNCDLNPTSRHLIDEKAFSLMKPEAVLINTARGPIVEEEALVTALAGGQIAGAAMDVYEYEPLPDDSQLREFSQVLLAPHNANSSPQAWEKVHWNTIKNLLDGLGIDYQINERGEIL
ncbi:MAG: dihydrofolate reductase [Bacteroidetes bacterium]|nr:MAG: dihydrofolate reductase [Bacteroidota bacterium]